MGEICEPVTLTLPSVCTPSAEGPAKETSVLAPTVMPTFSRVSMTAPSCFTVTLYVPSGRLPME